MSKFDLGDVLISSEILERCTEQNVRDALDRHLECQWDDTDTMWVLDNMINIKKGSGDVRSEQGLFYIITDLLIKRTDVYMIEEQGF